MDMVVTAKKARKPEATVSRRLVKKPKPSRGKPRKRPPDLGLGTFVWLEFAVVALIWRPLD